MKKLITVEQKHIDAGKVGVAHFCPVALAIKDTLGLTKVLAVGVTRREINAYSAGKSKSPRSVSRFVDKFDSHEPVKPFRFWFNTEQR